MNTFEKIRKSSGNVFADIGVAFPEKVRARAEIMFLVSAIIRKRGLTQHQAAKLLGIPQSKVSCLVNGKLSMFSLDHLFRILNALDNDVQIIVKPRAKSHRQARTRVLQLA